jgi:hypothetical protein
MRKAGILTANRLDKIKLLGQAAARGAVFDELLHEVSTLDYEQRSVLFVLGRVFRGKFSTKFNSIFGQKQLESQMKKYSPALVRVVEFYCDQMHACRQSVDAWTLVGLRFGVVKDIRKLIGKLIWDSREEALHKETVN